jgi:hypothetical protein
MRHRLPVIVGALSLATQAAAQSTTQPQCFDVVNPHAQAGPYVDILIDRCTGATWFLSAVPIPATQTAAASFYWEWFPLSVAATPSTSPPEAR